MNIKKLIFVGTMVLLLASVVLQSITTIKMHGKVKMAFDNTGKATNKADPKVMDAAEFYENNSAYLIAAPVTTLVGMSLMGVLVVMG